MSDFWSDPSSTSILCVRTAKALARLRRCAGSPEPSLVAYLISTIISWAGSDIAGENELIVTFPKPIYARNGNYIWLGGPSKSVWFSGLAEVTKRRYRVWCALLKTRGPLVLYRSTKCIGYAELEHAWKYITISMLSNNPGGARIGTKIPDWMSNNLAGREK